MWYVGGVGSCVECSCSVVCMLWWVRVDIIIIHRNIKYTDDTIIRSCCDGPIISKNNLISFLLFTFFASLWPPLLFYFNFIHHY